jgi:hypothetical protein
MAKYKEKPDSAFTMGRCQGIHDAWSLVRNIITIPTDMRYDLFSARSLEDIVTKFSFQEINSILKRYEEKLAEYTGRYVCIKELPTVGLFTVGKIYTVDTDNIDNILGITTDSLKDISYPVSKNELDGYFIKLVE